MKTEDREVKKPRLSGLQGRLERRSIKGIQRQTAGRRRRGDMYAQTMKLAGWLAGQGRTTGGAGHRGRAGDYQQRHPWRRSTSQERQRHRRSYKP